MFSDTDVVLFSSYKQKQLPWTQKLIQLEEKFKSTFHYYCSVFGFINQAFAQWNTYFDLITERDFFPDIGQMSFINPRVGLATSAPPPILGNQNFRGGT